MAFNWAAFGVALEQIGVEVALQFVGGTTGVKITNLAPLGEELTATLLSAIPSAVSASTAAPTAATPSTPSATPSTPES